MENLNLRKFKGGWRLDISDQVYLLNSKGEMYFISLAMEGMSYQLAGDELVAMTELINQLKKEQGL